MSRFVRSSKYRHVFGTQAKNEQCFANVQPTRSAWDSNFVFANKDFWAVPWSSAGGGTVGVFTHQQTGKLPRADIPLIAGHKGAVLDCDWNPFNNNLLATVSEDGTVKVWGIPEGGLTATIKEPLQKLVGHKRKVGSCTFHPTANNVLATSSTDYTVKIWDIEAGEEKLTMDGWADIIQSVSWNEDGSQLATTCKDKKIRVYDPRTNSFAAEAAGHQGVKGSRCLWLHDKLFSVGSSRMSEREFNIYDPRAMEKPIHHTGLDNASGVIMPFFDPDTNMLFLAGKGDGNIRYFEWTGEDKLIYSLSEFKSSTPQRGMTFLPKTSLQINECEVMKAYKLTTNAVQPISFKVPRKSEMFQDDIFPDTASGAGEAAQTASEYFGGANKPPVKISLAPGFVPKEKPKAEFKPVVKEEPKGPATEAELRKEWEQQQTRIAYLEAEIKKRDLKIKELEGK